MSGGPAGCVPERNGGRSNRHSLGHHRKMVDL